MSYIRSKMINGFGPYYYEVKSVREGKRVRQMHIRYVGKHPEAPEIGGDTAPVDTSPGYTKGSGHLDFDSGAVKARKESKKWDKLRYARAKRIADATGCNYMQADALAKTAIRMDLDPDTFDWDQLQGKDLSYDDKLRKMQSMTGLSVATEEDYELKHELYIQDEARREEYRRRRVSEGDYEPDY